MAEKAFLGKGMKFPPGINPASGRFEVTSGAASVRESVYMILSTQFGERFVRPAFGSDLQSYTFMDVNMTNISLMTRELTRQIESQEPRIRNVDITVDSVTREGCLLIDIGYYLIDSNTRDNLVFPFYLDTVSEEEEFRDDSFQLSGDYYEPVEESID